MRTKYTFLFLLLILFISVNAFAQRVTGSIKGNVTDEEGGPLPGVSITLKSEALIGGPQVNTSDNDGGYRFPGLPPGSYTLTFEMPRFQTVVHDQVRVVLGTTVEEN